MTDAELATEIKAFIAKRFLGGDDEGLSETTMLLSTSIIDSFGVMELFTFLRDRFQIQVAVDDIQPEFVETINAVVALVRRSTGRPG